MNKLFEKLTVLAPAKHKITVLAMHCRTIDICKCLRIIVLRPLLTIAGV